ncbi:MAG: large repetitive protein, partial [Thermoanaerobaculia bacterium]|nr:large repetitive protein [Thermoanaerobaculia bacterium]
MNMDIRVFVRAAAMLAMVVASLSASGAVVTWDGGGADDNWSTAANWSLDLLPTSSDDVIITNVTGIAMVNVNATVKSITVQNGAFLRIEPGQILTVSNGSLIAAGGNLHVTSTATWSGNGLLSVNGAVNMNGNSTIDGSGGLTINSGGSLDVVSNASFSIISRSTTNYGTITLQNDVMTGITFNGDELANVGVIDFQTNQGINTTMGTPVLTNLSGGIIKKTVGSGSAAITFPVDNQAGGTIQVQTGSLALNGGGTGSGTYSISAGKTLTLGGGTLTLTGSPTFSGAGTLSIAGGTLNAATSVTLNNVTLSSAGTITGTSAVNLSGNFNWSGGTISGSGSRVINLGSTPSIT